jgi:GNAT superfamily N-acetyltransferase
VEITRLNASEIPAALDDLAELLVDVVEGGASVGFVLPFTASEAAAWWSSNLAGVADGRLVVLVASDGGRIVGIVQLSLAPWSNGRHRAEVNKLLVRTAWRRRGTARALMSAIEDEARQIGRWLLVLDTMRGGAAEQLYRSTGWIEVGPIPDYAAWPDGSLGSTVVYYKRLEVEQYKRLDA